MAGRPGRKAGKPPALDNRPDAAAILDELREPGANIKAISVRLGVHRNTLRSFRDRHLPKSVRDADARLSRLPRPALQVSQEERLNAAGCKLEMMLEAIDRALRDPADPTRYNLDPRAREVSVVYERTVGDRTVPATAKLADLLERVESGLGVEVVRVDVKSADIRTLMPDLVSVLRPLAETIGKARGEFKPDPGISLNLFLESKDWSRVQATLLESLRPYPPALEAAGRALATLGGADDAR
jgi:transposase-like protein